MLANIHYLFDVDGTLTLPRRVMTENFAAKLLNWGYSHSFSIVSGSDLKKVQEQVPQDILNQANYIFVCSGNECYTNDGDQLKLVYSNSFVLDRALEDYLNFELRWASWHGPIFENNFELRPGMLNFSVIGRDAPQDWRDDYEKWSNHDGDRKRIVNCINERFHGYEASVGGQISIDVVHSGFHKGQVLNMFDLSSTWIEFYGDKIESGNDRPLALRINELGCGFACQVSGPDELGRLLFEEEEENEVLQDEDNANTNRGDEDNNNL